MSWLPDWLTGFDREAYEAGLEADRQNQIRNDELYERGLLTDENYAVTQDHFRDTQFDPDQQISAAFGEGLQEDADNIRGAVGGTLNSVLGTTFKLIPWQLWLAGAVYLAWRLGAFSGLLKRR